MNPLKKAREDVRPKLSYRQAASALGIGLTTLQRREGKGFAPECLSILEIEAMARLYGVTVTELLGRDIRLV